MKQDHAKEVQKFWNERSKFKNLAGTNDFVLKEIEIAVLKRHLMNHQRVIEFGCGSGVTAIQLVKTLRVDILAFDYAESMVNSAREALSKEYELIGSVRFDVGDIRSMHKLDSLFDVAITERVLINLASWEEQRDAISRIVNTLKSGGRYLMCENSINGLDRINELRRACGLDNISPPWHNRYFKEEELEAINLPNAKLVSVEHFSSSYYFVSRVINAWLAKQNGEEPRYDAQVNKLGLVLPEIGNFGQTKLWIFERI